MANMRNLLIVATSALCVLLSVAVPVPEQDVQIVQIPLEGNKVCKRKRPLCAIEDEYQIYRALFPLFLSLLRLTDILVCLSA